MVVNPTGSLGISLVSTFNTNATFHAADGTFRLLISSSAGSSFASDGDLPGIKEFIVSLNPSSASYIGKVLNTDPNKFSQEKHLLYTHFPVDSELAQPAIGNAHYLTVGLLSGSTGTSSDSGHTSMSFADMFGHFDTRYQAPQTTTS